MNAHTETAVTHAASVIGGLIAGIKQNVAEGTAAHIALRAAQTHAVMDDFDMARAHLEVARDLGSLETRREVEDLLVGWQHLLDVTT